MTGRRKAPPSHLTSLADQFDLCTRCGTCRAVCPVYGELAREPAVARGKVALIESLAAGRTTASKSLTKILSACLLCGSCADKCPNGVRADLLVAAARGSLNRDAVTKRVERALVRRATVNRDMARRGGALLEALLCETIPGTSGLRLRFSLPFFNSDRLIPKIADRPFLEKARSIPPSRAGHAGGRVALFTGCMVNYLNPEIGEAALRVLTKLGLDVVVPDGQVCCGLPALSLGDFDTAARLARDNVNAFSGIGDIPVLFLCASCGGMLADYYPRLFEGMDEEGHAGAGFLGGRAEDISTLVLRRGRETGLLAGPDEARADGPGGRVITYHDPCHLSRGFGVTTEPRALLDAAPGLERREMECADACCGFGGLFSLHHEDLSQRILAKKIENLSRTGAQVAATGCPGCILQLREGAHRAGLDLDVRHTIEILDEAL